MAVYLSPIGNGAQYFTTGGLPLNGGFLYTYQAGTVIPQATYTTSLGNIANSNPIALGADGRPPNEVWLTNGVAYKFVLTDAAGVPIPGGTYDNINGITGVDALAASTGASLVGAKKVDGTPTTLDQLDTANGALMVGVKRTATGTILHPIDDALKQSVSIIEWMSEAQIADAASGTNTQDCSAALQSAITYCVANNYDLEVPYLIRVDASVNIDRAVDGLAYDSFFTIFSNTGGGIYVNSAVSIFSSSIAYTNAPVTQLVRWQNLRFVASSSALAAYVLNGPRFLRSVFAGCSFSYIKCLTSNSYLQSLYFIGCNARRWSGDFMGNGAPVAITFTGSVGGATSGTLSAAWTLTTGTYGCVFSNGDIRTVTLTNGATTCTWTGALTAGTVTTATVSTSQAYDIQVIGGMWEHGTGNGFNLQAPIGCKFWTLLEGISGTALALSNCQGVDISSYFEGNGLDFDCRTNSTVPNYGVNIHGCVVANSTTIYTFKWGAAEGCVSNGNRHTGYMHDLQSNSAVEINDNAQISLSNLDAVANIGHRLGNTAALAARGAASASYTVSGQTAKYTYNGKRVQIDFLLTLTSSGTNPADQLYIPSTWPTAADASMVSQLCGQVEVVGSTTNNGISPLFITSVSPLRVASSINVIPSNTTGNSWTVRGQLSYISA